MASTRDRQGACTVTVTADEAGRRIDNFLNTRLRDIPRARLYRMLRQGEVRVNGARIRQDYRLQDGDVVRIPPLWRHDTRRPPITDATAARLDGSLLYEDDDLLVVDKPSGLAVHGGSGLRYGVIGLLRTLRPDEPRLELVHRLDRETSGCLLIARNLPVLQRLHRLLREGGIQKSYLAVLRGRLARGEQEIEQPLRRGRPRPGGRMVAVDRQGKSAATRIRRRKRYRDATLAEIDLLTGRTHQIRVHAAAIGHPLAGDRKYGDPAFNELMHGLGLRRLFLHAAALEIPALGLKVSAPLPEELESVLERLLPLD